MRFDPERVLEACGPDGDPGEALVAADWFFEQGDLHLAASALDRAFGLAPDDASIALRRTSLLDSLAVEEHGLLFRYVPAGSFRMGSEDGDPDERPVHRVRTAAYHVAEVPMTWAAFCHLNGWSAPPDGAMPSDVEDNEGFAISNSNKIRFQYCETETEAARDWHAHAAHLTWRRNGELVAASEAFGTPQRAHPERPWAYDRKPMVAVSRQAAMALAAKLSTPNSVYRLPTEAEWEKAARGGRIDAPYPWGHAPPTRERCDANHMGQFAIRDPRTLPPNDYGLYGMAGGVWEWTSDPYWALAYRAVTDETLEPPEEPEQYVLRGGSWSDSAYAVRVSFRMGRHVVARWGGSHWSAAGSPNIGFRLVRAVRPHLP
ncbi:MAG: SUMF1/EgtB/PvdO family nonheme iron enzyme [Myxococcota bacterium]